MNDEKLGRKLGVRRSRFEWLKGDVEIIKNPDQEANPKPNPSKPSDTDPAAPVPDKDDDQQDG